MKRSQVFILALASAFILMILHLVAISLHLYWTIWWLDLVFHFWGGVIVGSLAVSMLIKRSDSVWRAAFVVGGSVLVVALLWEVQEFVSRSFYAYDYIVDTISDILLGMAGGLTSFLVAHRALSRNKRISNAK